MFWDIFCKVIDNHGDIGVCWRLCADLASRGETVRLWVDDGSALAWMAPDGHPGVQVIPWSGSPLALEPGDVVVEAFGCEPDAAFIRAMARRQPTHALAWINLEYLTAERFAQRSHGLPSPVFAGPGAGLVRHFFYPGFAAGTGGLLREPGLLERQARFDPQAWLAANGGANGGVRMAAQRISLFCYEPPALEPMIARWAQAGQPVELLVTQGRAAQATRAIMGDQTRRGALSVRYLPWFSQLEFDHLLWSCDFNFVRGEDSLVRALWAGKPFAWQIYPQHDDAHHAKLHAFLDWLQAPASLRRFHAGWNGMTIDIEPFDPSAWLTTAVQARDRLAGLDDLTTQLIRFAQDIRRGATGHAAKAPGLP